MKFFRKQNMKILSKLLFGILLSLASIAHSHTAQTNYTEAGFTFYREKNISIPMRDGIKLAAKIYRPTHFGRFPVLIFRTPYDKNENDPDNESTFLAAVKRGYAVVIEDVRGRYGSEGEFTPYKNEGNDGYDTIEWAAHQTWSDGKIGTFGLSYPGEVQWLAAIKSPPHLKAMVPAMVAWTMNQFIYFGGIFESDWIPWTYKYISPDIRVRKHLPGPKTIAAAKNEYDRLGVDAFYKYLPTLAMPYLKDVAPFYYDWLKHPPYSPYWAWGNFQNKYNKVHVAILNLSGWYDEPYGVGAAIHNYEGLISSRADQKDVKTKLLIGPWTHGVDATKSNLSGERIFSKDAAINYDKTVLDFLDHYVRGIDNGIENTKPIRIFIMGDNKWIESDIFPLKNTINTTMYLENKDNKGILSKTQIVGKKVSSYLADPQHPVNDKFDISHGAYDLSYLDKRSDVLIFETPPLEKNFKVIGNIRPEIYLSCDAPDCDLFVQILDVNPDGKAFNLMSPGETALRVSYRNKTEKRELLHSGQIVKLIFPNLYTANDFKKGHRIRVLISSSWYPTYSRNLQTGKLESVSAKIRKAKISIYHDKKYPSKIIFPVVQP